MALVPNPSAPRFASSQAVIREWRRPRPPWRRRTGSMRRQGWCPQKTLPTVGRIAERHPGLKLIVDHMGVPRASKGEAAYRFHQNCWLWPNTQTSRSRRRGRPATPRTNTRSAACTRTCIAVSTPLVPSGCSGAPTSPACLAPGGSA